MAEAETGRTESSPKSRNIRRVRQGTVVSDRRDKTIKVEATYLAKHRVYGKYLRKRTVLHAHDQRNEANLGDIVDIMECRPISKTKQWRLVRIVKRNPLAETGSATE
jgi:small subunit ribosomal protein S17